MAERSTARPADGAARHNDDPSDVDSWIAHLARPAADDFDTHDEWPEAAAPQWHENASDPYEEPYQPEETNQGQEGRHARHRADQQDEEYEQYDGAHGQDEHAYRGSDPLAEPALAGYEPDQPYQYDEHEQASWEGRTQAPYGPIDAGPVREDAYVGLQDTYLLPDVGYAQKEHFPHDDYAGPNEYRHGKSAPQDPEAVDDAPTQVLHIPELDAHPRPASRRRWLIAVGGLALGALLCVMAFTWGSGQPPEGERPLVIATIPPEASEEPIALPEIPSATPISATPRSSPATPRTTRSVTHSATPSAAPSVTRSATPAQTRSPSPVLLGPSSNDGVANMVQGYCDRHAVGSSAEPRNDGRWQCTRLLSASAVDMNVACRDTYGSGASARTSTPGDPYAWRCYR
ncbi:hypothetical protein GA0074695_2366 [Micromonospora viridifaciens]|uniref:Uncharacterized protein n=1 Tax=Micromonospora viridifaciens TaxID=1881 RepID=A0A1C4WEW9_MICVI|nr:hypothetical protein [Micromonospora viridifaciens]SCE94734.1 hypothetical protein GA0074695_2366 [Micromonospora viridifaciens]